MKRFLKISGFILGGVVLFVVVAAFIGIIWFVHSSRQSVKPGVPSQMDQPVPTGSSLPLNLPEEDVQALKVLAETETNNETQPATQTVANVAAPQKPDERKAQVKLVRYAVRHNFLLRVVRENPGFDPCSAVCQASTLNDVKSDEVTRKLIEFYNLNREAALADPRFVQSVMISQLFDELVPADILATFAKAARNQSLAADVATTGKLMMYFTEWAVTAKDKVRLIEWKERARNIDRFKQLNKDCLEQKISEADALARCQDLL